MGRSSSCPEDCPPSASAGGAPADWSSESGARVPFLEELREQTGRVRLRRLLRLLCRALLARSVRLLIGERQQLLLGVDAAGEELLEATWVSHRAPVSAGNRVTPHEPEVRFVQRVEPDGMVGSWLLGELGENAPIRLEVLMPPGLTLGEREPSVEDATELLLTELAEVRTRWDIVRFREEAALEVAVLFERLLSQGGGHHSSAMQKEGSPLLGDSTLHLPHSVEGPLTEGDCPSFLRVRTLVENFDAGMLVEDNRGVIQICNQRLLGLFGVDERAQIWLGRTSHELERRLSEEVFDPEGFGAATAALRSDAQRSPPELVVRATMQILERLYAPLCVAGTLVGHLFTYRDVTLREQSRQLLEQQAEELRALSLVDELTGLYNRRGFLTIATQQIKVLDRSAQKGLVVFLDLDNLKTINDLSGHDRGDLALIETARVLRHCFRNSDVIARLGGDEFIVFALGTGEESEALVRERLGARLAEANQRSDIGFPLAFSLGIADYDPARGEMIEEVIARADVRMYEEKRRHHEGGQRS